jgi:hypothetical protein
MLVAMHLLLTAILIRWDEDFRFFLVIIKTRTYLLYTAFFKPSRAFFILELHSLFDVICTNKKRQQNLYFPSNSPYGTGTCLATLEKTGSESGTTTFL